MKTKENNFVKNSIKYLIPLIPVVLVAVMTGLLFDTYYDINDDSAIRNILSGVFSGEPSPMAVYVEYPFALIFSLMYKIFPAIPWFGFIEHVMLYGSLYLVAFSLSNRTENKLLKIILSVFAGYIFEALLFYRIIYVQYTTVAGITAAAGAVGFLFSDDKADGKHFLISSIPCIICEVLAFCLRPNMMAVELPMIGVVYIVKWLKGSKENDTKCFNGKNIVKYFMPLFIVTALMALSFITNRIAYSTNGWKEYSRFNDARTTILDFQEFIPPYDENFDFYDSIGWEEVDTVIVRNYNIAVDDRITAENLEKLAEYNEDAHGLGYFKKGVKESLIYYKYKLTHTSEYKYAYGVIAL